MLDDVPDHVLFAGEPDAANTVRHRNTNTPPHDTDAELAVLGAMLISLDACDYALNTGLTADHFYNPRHGRVLTAITKCLANGDKPDPITVAGHDNTLDTAWLVGVQIDAPSTTNAATYARRIIGQHRLRTITADALEAAEAARTGNLDGALGILQTLAANQPDDDNGSTWSPIDLTSVIDGDGPPAPTMLMRRDGEALLYPGRIHAFNAESESGKSWLACAAAAERMYEGEHVVYLDFEDHASGIVGRLRALGVPAPVILEYLHYVRPDDPISPVATAALERILVDHRPTLAIIDGVTEVMVQNGWSINDNDDAAKFLLALPRRIARHECAVVIIDHLPKDKESRGRGGIGAQHKLAGIDGVSYRLEVTAPFGIGRDGSTRITVDKDRPGHVRGYALDGRFVAEMHVRSLPDGGVDLELCTPHGGPTETHVRPTTLMERVSKAIEEQNAVGIEPTKNVITTEINGKRVFVLEALKRLVAEGYVEVKPGPNRSHLHSLTRPYRVADDPSSEAYEPLDDNYEEGTWSS